MLKPRAHILLALILGVCLLPIGVRAEGAVREMDFRIVLAQLAQKVGANGQIAILQAQGPNPAPALVVQGGTLGLAEVAATSDALHANGDGVYTLTRPLLVWADADLRIERDEEIKLDANAGAFLAVLGGIEVDGGSVTAALRSADPDVFHPFLLVAGQGHITATDARFENLGFGTIPAFSGVALINRGIFPSLATSRFEANSFLRLGALSLLSVEDAAVIGNTLRESVGTGISIRAGARIKVQDTRVIAPGGHGVRISEGSREIAVTDTVIERPARTGILADSRSTALHVQNNVVHNPGASGLQFDDAFCARLVGNTVTDGAGSGITIQRSAHLALSGNSVTGNHGAGLAVNAQPRATPLQLSGNVFSGNRVGIRGNTPGALQMIGNDFSNQFPRFLDGDLTMETRRVALDLRGEAPFTVEGAFDTRAVIVPDCTIPGGT